MRDIADVSIIFWVKSTLKVLVRFREMLCNAFPVSINSNMSLFVETYGNHPFQFLFGVDLRQIRILVIRQFSKVLCTSLNENSNVLVSWIMFYINFHDRSVFAVYLKVTLTILGAKSWHPSNIRWPNFNPGTSWLWVSAVNTRLWCNRVCIGCWCFSVLQYNSSASLNWE